MIRTLFIIAGAALVLCIVTVGGAIGLGGQDLQRHGWAWTFKDDNGESVRFERVKGGGTDDLGPMTTRNIDWTGTDSLTIDSSVNVDFIQGADAGVVVTGPRALVDRVQLDGGRLSLTEGDERVVFGWDSNGPTARSQRDELRVVITAPAVTRFRLEGSGHLDIRGYDQDQMRLDISGSGEIEAEGRTRALTLDISGSGEVDLGALELADANVAVSGSGEARLGPTGRAAVDISGSGDVTLTRRPESLDSRISGSGDIRQP